MRLLIMCNVKINKIDKYTGGFVLKFLIKWEFIYQFKLGCCNNVETFGSEDSNLAVNCACDLSGTQKKIGTM